jgi:hypothetical protein
MIVLNYINLQNLRILAEKPLLVGLDGDIALIFKDFVGAINCFSLCFTVFNLDRGVCKNFMS